MSEEEFKPIRITLSDEAFNRLNTIMKEASFRNYSSAIEECIRVVHDIMGDIWAFAGKKGQGIRTINQKDGYDGFMTIVTRMERFTSRRVGPPKQQSDSAGP